MNVIVTIVANTPPPAGAMATHYSYSIMQGTALIGAPVVTADLTTTFAVTVPGNYTAEAVAVDANGIAIGTPLSVSFTIPTPSLLLPTTISVTLQ